MSKSVRSAKSSSKSSAAVPAPKTPPLPTFDIKTTKSASCPNLSGQTGLTYEIGKDTEDRIYIRVASNTGGGFFSPEWIAWEKAYAACASSDPLTSMALKPLFRSKSVNSAGFFLAVMLTEDLVRRKPQWLRHYELTPAAQKLARKGSGKTSDESPADSTPAVTPTDTAAPIPSV